MTKQNDRTHSGKSEANTSGWTIQGFDSQARWAFSKWLPRFEKIIRTDELTADWNSLLTGCDSQDLQWALYWAIDSLDAADHAPKKLRAFHEQSVDVLRKIKSLRPALHELVESRVLGEPVTHLYWLFFGLPIEEIIRFWGLPTDLAWFEARLKLFTGRRAPSSGARFAKVGATAAARRGAVVHVYVTECMGDPHHRETSVLLEAAAKAYNYDGRRSFSQGAVEHRYTRFCRYHREEVKEIECGVRELLSKRSKSAARVDLIPYLMARDRARAQPAIDYVKERYLKPSMPS
jgi:hypothetical protein